MTLLAFGSGTDIGNHSDHNEDSLFTDPQLGLWLIADGMGGHEAGEVASAIVSETVSNEVRNGTRLVEAIEKAHREVIEAGERGDGAKGMGSTIVALQVKGERFEVAWVGDSRAYLWDGELRQISRDHSYVQKLLDSGAITEDEALHHPNRNIITQSLGADLSSVVVDNITGTFLKGQHILLCSDGLSDEVSDPEIANILGRDGDDQTHVNNLIQAALDHGGKDNVTVLMVSAPDNAPEQFQEFASSTQEIDPADIQGPAMPLKLIGAGVVVLCLIIIMSILLF